MKLLFILVNLNSIYLIYNFLNFTSKLDNPQTYLHYGVSSIKEYHPLTGLYAYPYPPYPYPYPPYPYPPYLRPPYPPIPAPGGPLNPAFSPNPPIPAPGGPLNPAFSPNPASCPPIPCAPFPYDLIDPAKFLVDDAPLLFYLVDVVPELFVVAEFVVVLAFDPVAVFVPVFPVAVFVPEFAVAVFVPEFAVAVFVPVLVFVLVEVVAPLVLP